jgi:DNA repair exonuclease SbcCD ATPase subunit
MKNILFKQLTIKNFLSVGETPVEIDFIPGLHIITGINKDKVDRRNGVGKSTVADALYFALYGSTLRELKKEFISNNISSGRCEVALTLIVNQEGEQHEYKIVRLLSPTKCYIYKNGEDCTRDTILNTTEFINNLINTSEDVFQNCVLMTVNNTVPFMAKKRLDKRKFIEGILNLEVFSSMINMLRNEYNETRRELETECTILDEVQTTYNNYQEQKKLNDNNKEEKYKKYNTRQEDNVNELKSIDKQIKDMKVVDSTEYETKLNVLNVRQQACDNKITDNSNKLVEHKTNISVLLKQLETLSGVTTEPVCPTCLRTITSGDKDHIIHEKDKIKDKIKILKNGIDDENKQKESNISIKKIIQERIDRNNILISEAKVTRQQLENYKIRRAQLETWQAELVQDLEDLDAQSNQFDKLINDTDSRLVSIRKNIKKVKQRIEDLDVVKFVVSEEGVKSYIVKKILQLLNSKLAYYLKKMDSNCILFFNEYFEEQIVDDKGKICSYFNFSGAERKNIDLSCLFTFMDIRRLQGDVSFNVSMYDELFDSSLDEKGVDLVIEILRERLEKYNECMYVISHRKESVNFTTRAEIRNGEIIFLQKDNGITTRVEFDPEKYKL